MSTILFLWSTSRRHPSTRSHSSAVSRTCMQTRLEERLAELDVELTAIKEYQDHSEIYQQTVRFPSVSGTAE